MPSHVDDSESLYRSIRSGSDDYSLVDGQPRISTKAFDDRGRKPSVDRSAICIRPEYAKKAETDGVAKLTTHEVREISGTIYSDPDKRGIGTQTYLVDVMHRPIIDEPPEPDNLAHCQVECHPTIDNDSRFKKLKEALAAIANKYGLVVQPTPSAPSG